MSDCDPGKQAEAVMSHFSNRMPLLCVCCHSASCKAFIIGDKYLHLFGIMNTLFSLRDHTTKWGKKACDCCRLIISFLFPLHWATRSLLIPFSLFPPAGQWQRPLQGHPWAGGGGLPHSQGAHHGPGSAPGPVCQPGQPDSKLPGDRHQHPDWHHPPAHHGPYEPASCFAPHDRAGGISASRGVSFD